MQLSSHALAFGLCIPLAALAGFLINEYLWRTKVLPKHVKRAYLTGLRRSRLLPTLEQLIRRGNRRDKPADKFIGAFSALDDNPANMQSK